MKLSFWERMVVNSPVRAWSLHLLEPWVFRRILAFPQGKRVLDVGCGNGQGLLMLARRAKPASLMGIDLDPKQVARAKARLAAAGVQAEVRVGKAEQIFLAAKSVDVVTSLGCIHHVPDWRAAAGECARVLAVGGVVYMLEFYRPLLRMIHWLAPHPTGRFTHEDLVDAVGERGLKVVGEWQVLGMFGVVVARKE